MYQHIDIRHGAKSAAGIVVLQADPAHEYMLDPLLLQSPANQVLHIVQLSIPENGFIVCAQQDSRNILRQCLIRQCQINTRRQPVLLGDLYQVHQVRVFRQDKGSSIHLIAHQRYQQRIFFTHCPTSFYAESKIP